MKQNFFSDYKKALKAETLKMKHSSMWFAVLSIPLVSVLIGSGSFYINQEIMKGDPWFDLWTQVALFYGYFFYPLLIAVIAAYLWRIERLGTNWNSLRTTPVSSGAVWSAKLTILFEYALITQIIMIFFYFLSATFLLKLPGTIPSYFWWWLVAGPICVLASGSMNLFIAERIKSFALVIAIAFVSCFIGLACYAKGLWLYPNTLAIIGMNAQHEGIPTFMEMIKAFGGTLFWTVFFSVLGTELMFRKND